MVQKTKIITSGATFTVPLDFGSLIEVHAISGGQEGNPSYGGSYNAASDEGAVDLSTFSVSPGDVLDIQVGVPMTSTLRNDPGGDLRPNETWMKDNVGTIMVLAPTSATLYEGLLDPVYAGFYTVNPPIPSGTAAHRGGKGAQSGGAAAGPRAFGPEQGDPYDASGSPEQTPQPYGDQGSNDNPARGGGGGAIVDPGGAGFPGYPGDGLCDGAAPAGGDGANNSLGTGGGTTGSPNGTNGGGGRGGDDPAAITGNPVDGGDGGDGQTWQDSDTLLWAGPGGGGGGGGNTFADPTNGGDGGNYGGGGGTSGGIGTDGAAGPGVLIFIYDTDIVEPVDVCQNLAGYTDDDLPQVEAACDWEWPFDVLRPQAVGIFPVQATLGGGPSLAGNEETEVAEDPAAFPESSAASTPSIAGFWRVSYGGVPLRTLDQVRQWRAGQTILNGRSGVCCVHLYDGKRAPWPNPLAAITAEADGAMAVGDDSGDIRVTSGSALLPGMHFSADERAYRLVTVDAPSGDPPVYPVTFWPRVRKAIADGDPLEFAHPICRMRLAKDDGMSVKLDLMRFATPSVDWVEDI